MKTIISAAIALALAAGPLSAAQLYRWVDEKGNVEWRDTPPPANAKKVEQRTVTGNTIDTSSVPFSVQQAMKTHPVTLWTYDCGEPCTDARKHLARRGIPYTERNSQKELESLRKATGGTQVPVLIVGATQIKGYLESSWDAALDSAGYPKSAVPGVKVPASTAKSDAPKGAAPAAAK
jgi:glutaredoxin